MTGAVNLINFGWMYQGLWQMCKLALSEEAKSKVNFPKVKDLKAIIDEENLPCGKMITVVSEIIDFY